MPRYFTHYWANETWNTYRQTAVEGELVDYAASNRFRARGVSHDDLVYIVTVIQGVLFLLTKLQVAEVYDVEDAATDLGTTPDFLWDAEDHIVASQSAPQSFDRQVPIAVVQSLRFHSGGQPVPPKFRSPGRIDQQTLRGVRELMPEPAAELDRLLLPVQPLHSEQRKWRLAALSEEVHTAARQVYVEGAVRQITINAYERNPQARMTCVVYWGLACTVCGFDFEAFYGPIGRGYIHVHHLHPLADIGEEYQLDPVADMRPVCPNCHAMIHRGEPVYTIEEVRALIAGVKVKVWDKLA